MYYDKAYVISLENSARRRKRFYQYAQRACIDVEWFPAIYGLDVDIDDYHQRGYLADNFELRMAGSLGTLLSHVHLWEKIAEDPECRVGLIFEDDAVFKEDFKTMLQDVPNDMLPDDWDMLWLGWHRLACTPLNTVVGKPRKSRRSGMNSGHFAYLIKSSSVEKMKSLLIPYNNTSSKDVILRRKFDQFKAFFLLKRMVRTPLIGFDSVRKKINNPNHVKYLIGKLLPKMAVRGILS